MLKQKKLLCLVVLIAILTLVDAQQRQQQRQGGQQQQQRQQQKQQPKPKKPADYYQVMGLKKDATEDQIKKAFKKQAIKYHPDKNPDDPEGAKAKFQEVANAYEVLSDQEKRRIYDQTGEEGVRQHDQRQSQEGGGAQGQPGGFNFQGQNFDDIFSQFFGGGGGFGGMGGPGGSQFNFNFGGGQGGGQQQQRQPPKEEKPPSLFEDTDVIKLDLSSVFQFYRRKEIWILYFYNPKLKACQDFKDEYVKLSEKMYGIIKVGAIDCLSEEELCEEFGAFDIPQVMIFSESFSDSGERYAGAMLWTPLANAAARKMQSFVSIVTVQNFESFTLRDVSKPHVLLFTDKKTTPAIFKSLSKKFLDKLVFGEVRHTEAELVAKFKVAEFPTLLVVTDIETLTGDKYSGEIKVDQLTKFLDQFAYKTIKPAVKFQKLTEKKYKSNALCGPKDSNICVIVFGQPSAQQEQLVTQFENDPVSFSYILPNEPGFQMTSSHFGGNAKAVLYKGKRLKYLKIEDLSNLQSVISDALGGGGNWLQSSALIFNKANEDL